MAITTVGLNTVRGLISSPQPVIPTHMAIGSGTTAFAVGDTTLEKENDRNALTSYDNSISKIATYVADFSSTEISGVNVSEFGLFNASSNGSLFQREVINNLVFAGDRELQIQTSFRISGA